MLTKIDNTIKYGKQRGGFGLQILFPGKVRPQHADSGLATLGRIDQARITPGTLIPMHPHRDDEILTYLRSGKVKHLDSVGYTDIISNQRLMLMNAGATFSHEELALAEGGLLEGLQIFIRPELSGLEPTVQFYQLPEVYSINQWRKLAGRGGDYPLQIRSDTWLMDMRLEAGKRTALPAVPTQPVAFLVYVFAGDVRVDDAMTLSAGESVLVEDEWPAFLALTTSDLVVFITRTDAVYFDGGMYSGKQTL